MNKLRQILRLHHLGIGKLKIAETTGVSRNTIKKYIKEFSQSGLHFSEVNVLCDKDLEDFFSKQESHPVNSKLETLFALFPSMDKELKKKVKCFLMSSLRKQKTP